jgi:tRNA(fMet)-specific endonuclease VapC
MLQFLFDTDHLTLYQHRHPPLLQHLASYALADVGVSAVTVEEALRGRLAALTRAHDGRTRIRQYSLLLETVQLFAHLTLVPFDQASENQYQQLRAMRLRVGTQDLKIAAVALANNLGLLTRNRRDFGRIPGLRLADWSV